jgi:hypothetical protein
MMVAISVQSEKPAGESGHGPAAGASDAWRGDDRRSAPDEDEAGWTPFALPWRSDTSFIL